MVLGVVASNASGTILRVNGDGGYGMARHFLWVHIMYA